MDINDIFGESHVAARVPAREGWPLEWSVGNDYDTFLGNFCVRIILGKPLDSLDSNGSEYEPISFDPKTNRFECLFTIYGMDFGDFSFEEMTVRGKGKLSLTEDGQADIMDFDSVDIESIDGEDKSLSWKA